MATTTTGPNVNYTNVDVEFTRNVLTAKVNFVLKRELNVHSIVNNQHGKKVPAHQDV